MATLEKRKVERFSNVFMVNFRQVNKSREYLLGIANNYSHKGIGFEAACIEPNPGEELELILKNPYSKLSVSAIGEIVWKMDGWYACMTGIKLKNLDQDAVNKLQALMENSAMACDEPPVVPEAAGRTKESEHEDIAAVDEISDETAPDAEIISPPEKTLSVSHKEGVAQAEDKAGIHLFRDPADKPLVKKIIIGMLLVASVLLVIKNVKIKAGVDEGIKQPGLSRNSDVTGRLPLNKVNTGARSARVADQPMINANAQSDMSQDSAAVRQLPVQRGAIIFDSDSDVIGSEYRIIIDTFAKTLLRDDGAILKVEGYSDSIGPELYNLDLAMRRALEVKKLLMKNGIHDRRIRVAVFGESYPVSANIDEFDNAGDRRVDIIMVPSPEVSVTE